MAITAVAAVIGLGVWQARNMQPDGVRRPSDPKEVIERVASQPARAGLRRELGARPDDLELALRLARLEIEVARRSGDVGGLGRAQAALAPWWDELEPPTDVLLLRATIRQSLHAFGDALGDLDRLIAREPAHPQGRLTRAVVLTVLGRRQEALADCEALARISSDPVVAGCQSPLEALGGDVPGAIARLTSALGEVPDPATRAWLLSLLGEIEFWDGRTVAAEDHLRAALTLAPDDRYTRGALADLLLDAGRVREVRSLIDERTEDDGLLLRVALAEGCTGSAARRLEARFRAAHRRGDGAHQREEARFALGRGEVERALALATAGFAVQREPWDARVLLEASAAARDRPAAWPALDWLTQTGFSSPRLRHLADGLAQTRAETSGGPL